MPTVKHSSLAGDELHTPFHYDVATYAEMIALTGMEAPDLCFITGDGGSPYIYNGTSWVAMSGPRTWVRETLNDLQSLNEAEGLQVGDFGYATFEYQLGLYTYVGGTWWRVKLEEAMPG